MYVYIYLYINVHGDVATLAGSPNIHTYYILIVYTLYINVLIYIFDPPHWTDKKQDLVPRRAGGGGEHRSSLVLMP